MRKNLVSLALFGTTIFAGSAFAGHLNELLEAELDGREEVGADPTQRLVGDPDGKGEAYVFGIDGDPTTLCYTLTVEKIQLVLVSDGMMAHIHEGVRDANGPVVAVLAGPQDGNAADCLTEGEEGKFPTGEAGIVQRILNNPEQFYINVHNPEYAAGAIRGQLKNQLHDHDDSGHTGSGTGNGSGNGDMAGVPSVPMNLRVDVYSPSNLEVFWDKSSDDGSVVAYEVYRNGSSAGVVDGPNYYDPTVQSGTTYTYSVVAIDDSANSSARSETISATTP